MQKISINVQENYYPLKNIEFEVVEKNIYTSFKEMIESEGIENVIPDKSDIEEATKVYYKFYRKEQENEFGVSAIKIKKIN